MSERCYCVYDDLRPYVAHYTRNIEEADTRKTGINDRLGPGQRLAQFEFSCDTAPTAAFLSISNYSQMYFTHVAPVRPCH